GRRGPRSTLQYRLALRVFYKTRGAALHYAPVSMATHAPGTLHTCAAPACRAGLPCRLAAPACRALYLIKTGFMPLILFNKPFQVLCQFSPQPGRESLAEYIDIPGIYPAGRLDADSEGLMLLTDDGKLQHKIAHPDHKEAKTYLVQVDGVADAAA